MDQDGLVQKLVDFGSDIFDEYYIQDPVLRTKMVQLMLESGDLMAVSGTKFDIDALLSQSADIPDLQDVRPSVNIRIGLTSFEQNCVAAANPDQNFKFLDGAKMPHGLAKANQIAQTAHAVRNVPVEANSFIDILGNYTAYEQQQYKFQVHVCSGEGGQQDAHRQQQRLNAIANGRQSVDYCTDYKQCEFVAAHGVCNGALGRIDPQQWITLFKRHKLQFVTGFLHYDAMLDTPATTGFITGATMYWVDKNGMLEFFFDNDSSFAYSQRRDWTVKYGRNWFLTEPGWDKVIEYRVVSFNGGTLSSRMTLLEKATLDTTVLPRQLRWVGGDDSILLPCPVFNQELGFGVKDPRAYEVRVIAVPESTYNFAYMKGFANDTARPDRPLSRDDIAGFVRAYNHRRTLNGTSITADVRMPAKIADQVATGIYLAVVYSTARNQVIMAKYSEQMIRMQRKWGNQGMLQLIGSCAKLTAITPFLMVCDTFQESLDVVLMHMRSVGCSSAMTSLPVKATPYVELLQEESLEGGSGKFVHSREERRGSVDDSDQKRRFYSMFRDEIPSDLKEKLEQELFNGVEPPREPLHGSEQPIPDEAVDNYADSTRFDNSLSGDIKDRQAWYEEFDELQQGAESWMYADFIEPEEATPDKVSLYARHAIAEYALYCADVHIGSVQKTLEFLRVHWKGGIDKRQVAEDNVTKEVQAVFYKVDDDGLVRGVDSELNRYDVLVDPHTQQFLPVVYKTDGAYVYGATQGLLYATKYIRIFNGTKLAKQAAEVLKSPFDCSKVEFHLYDGIAGGGKTNMCKKEFSVRDMFTTGPRAGADRIRHWVENESRFADCVNEASRRVRTSDSAIMHKIPGAQTLYVDEGLMQHSGVFWLLAVKSRAKKVCVTGDSRQIPLIDRSSGYGKLLYASKKFWSKITYLNETDRCPQDVTVRYRKFFPEWRQPLIKTTNPIKRSVTVEYAPDANDPRFFTSKNAEHVLVMLQGDKALMVAKPGFEDGKLALEQGHGPDHHVRPVLSVHESQGDTYLFSKIIRLNPHSTSVFESKPHRYVAMSRHMLGAQYVTAASLANDPLAQDVEEMLAYNDDELSSVYTYKEKTYNTILELCNTHGVSAVLSPRH